MTARPIVLAFVGHYLPGEQSGGPVRSIVNMVELLGDKLDFRIITRDRDYSSKVPYSGVNIDAWNSFGKAKVFYASPKMNSMARIVKLIRATSHDVVYLNSFFSWYYTIPVLLARRLRLIPFRRTVIAPRGELLSGTLSLKGWKKTPFLFLSRIISLYDGLTWHASNQFEFESIHSVMGISRERIIIAPNMTAMPKVGISEGDDGGRNSSEVFNVCFFSRISPEKNLEYALRTLASVKVPVSFNIYGSVSDALYWRKCQRLFKTLPYHVRVSYWGKIPHDSVPEVLAKNDLFFLPTFGENFGHVVFEALAAGLPVLVSDQTPWRGLEAAGIGWDFPLSDIEKFREVIEHQARLSPADRAGQRRDAHLYARRIAADKETLLSNLSLFKDVHQE